MDIRVKRGFNKPHYLLITLARALAREASAWDLSVKVADLDVKQGTLVNWQRRRLEGNHTPSFSVESFRDVPTALIVRNDYDLLVLDGPARASYATLEIARASDLVVQPTGASLDDLELPRARQGRDTQKNALLCAVQGADRGGDAGLHVAGRENYGPDYLGHGRMQRQPMTAAARALVVGAVGAKGSTS